MKNKKIWIGVLVAFFIVIFIGVAISKKPQTEETIGGFKSGPRVKVEVVQKGDIQTKISSSGKLEAKDSETIYAETNNKIIDIHKKMGDLVKKGEVILTLDGDNEERTQKQLETVEFQLKTAQDGLNQLITGGSKPEILNAQSAVVQAQRAEQDSRDMLATQKTNLRNLERDLNNQHIEYTVQVELFDEGLISQKELDDGQTVLNNLQQQLESTKTAIASAERSIESAALQKSTAEYSLGVLLNKIQDPTRKQSIALKQTEVKNLQTQVFNTQNDLGKLTSKVVASIDGVIVQVPTQKGMLISPGMVLVTIVDPSKLIINSDVSPYYAADLMVGLEAEIRYTGSTTVNVEGKVTRVSPIAVVNPNAVDRASTSATIPIEIEVPNPGQIIKPGFSVDVKVVTKTRKNVCIIPLLATIEEDDNTTFVYVVKENGELEKRMVTQGLSDGLTIEVDNIKEGEIVVSNPTEFLKEGMKVSYEKMGDMQ